MNAPHIPRPGLDTFHRERSKCIDAFAAVEEAVVTLLGESNIKFGAESFGHKLDLLHKIKASPQRSNDRVKQLHALLKRCEAINELRNDIVHSKLQMALIGEDQRACFTNLRDCQSGSQAARLFTLEGLRKLSLEMLKLADELGKA
jgi:hypothetical protein